MALDNGEMFCPGRQYHSLGSACKFWSTFSICGFHDSLVSRALVVPSVLCHYPGACGLPLNPFWGQTPASTEVLSWAASRPWATSRRVVASAAAPWVQSRVDGPKGLHFCHWGWDGPMGSQVHSEG
jgi:hypothetical protein